MTIGHCHLLPILKSITNAFGNCTRHIYTKSSSYIKPPRTISSINTYIPVCHVISMVKYDEIETCTEGRIYHHFEARECNKTFGISDKANICIHCGYEEEL